MDTRYGWYVVALPDTQSAVCVAAAADAPILARHASGRPWLLSTYPAEQVRLVADGADRVAVLGFSDVTELQLRRWTGLTDTAAALDDLAHEMAGSHVIVTSESGRVRMQGSALGGTRIFTAVVGGSLALADRADVLAHLGGHGCDRVALALRMLRRVPYPLADLPLWTGVDPVEPGRCVVVSPDGRDRRETTWWRRPEAIRSRAEGALYLAAALERAVRTRTATADTVYADLSGGFDSTPQAWFAAQGRARVITGTVCNNDPGGGEDLFWARRALKAMPDVEHGVYSTDDMPAFYGGLGEVHAALDDVTDTYRAAPRLVYSMSRAEELGARIYLHGLGGDDLFVGFPSYECAGFKRHPLRALHRLHTYRLLEQLSAKEAFGWLWDTRNYRQWLMDTVRAARERTDGASQRPAVEWDVTMSWPRWFSAELREEILCRVLAVAEQTDPLGSGITGHAELAAIRGSARIVRTAAQLGADRGMAFQSPISDDRVAEAVLSVRHEERFHPKEFKPLMREAMRGRLPDSFLERSRKNSGAPQAVRGMRDHGDAVLDLCRSSPLPHMGVVDDQALRRHALPGVRWEQVRDIDTTINGALFARNHALGGAQAQNVAV
jgi:asparagine synthase (glutamine-hydrolysing)